MVRDRSKTRQDAVRNIKAKRKLRPAKEGLKTPPCTRSLDSPSDLDTRVINKEDCDDESSSDDVCMEEIQAQREVCDKTEYHVRWSDGMRTWESEENIENTVVFQQYSWASVVRNLSNDYPAQPRALRSSSNRQVQHTMLHEGGPTAACHLQTNITASKKKKFPIYQEKSETVPI